ncbi:hypothetical protein [Microbispora sp. H10885]|uniref:hypothetical protein n=1 Tax=Microbispora sp. H10885 TaxID=2729110 RepID=UPI0016022179|nr:hypothetical protein [Microbispora sp. H10885]
MARPEPLPDFTLETCPGERDRFLVRCAEPPSGDLEFVLLSDPPPWPYSACLRVAEVRAAGRPLEGTPAPGGHLTRREAARPDLPEPRRRRLHGDGTLVRER